MFGVRESGKCMVDISQEVQIYAIFENDLDILV